MLQSSSNGTAVSLPIMVKILMAINILFFVAELAMAPLVSTYCLSPSRILAKPSEFGASLFLSNFFHLNPLRSGPFGLLHIILNMLTLKHIGTVLEKEFGSIAFLGITLFMVLMVGPIQIPLAVLLNSVSMGNIGIFSLYQCGLGFSGILFAFFMIYLKILPQSERTVYGFKVRFETMFAVKFKSKFKPYPYPYPHPFSARSGCFPSSNWSSSRWCSGPRSSGIYRGSSPD